MLREFTYAATGQSSRMLILIISLAVISSCSTESTEPDPMLTFEITDGACGEVVFVERIGTDSASAFAVIEARKVDQFGRNAVRLEAYRLGVVDANGQVPTVEFFALQVLDAQTGLLLHSVSEVITSEGDLFNLHWCPD